MSASRNRQADEAPSPSSFAVFRSVHCAMPRSMPTPEDLFKFPRSASEFAGSAIGAQLFKGAGLDGSDQTLWVEQDGAEWTIAWFVRDEPELACVWKKDKRGGLGALAAVWGGPLAEGLTRSQRADSAARSETLFLTLRMHAEALVCADMLTYKQWRPALAFKLAAQWPDSGFTLSEEEEAAIEAIDELLLKRPELKRPEMRRARAMDARDGQARA